MLNWEHETDMDGNWWHTIVEHSDVTLEVVIHEMNENAWHPYQWEVWDTSFDGMPEVSGSESTLEQAMEEAELVATNSVRWQPLENFAKKGHCMRITRRAHRKSAGMDEDDILQAIYDLSKSQGYYGRLFDELMDMQLYDPVRYDEVMAQLESMDFSDPVDLVMYLES